MAETMPQEIEQPVAPVDVAVVVVPLPAQGHLNQFLHLSCVLARRPGISVHYFGSASHNRQARDRSPSGVDEDRRIRFHDIPLSIASCPPPKPPAPAKFPVHLQPAFDAALDLRAPLAELCNSLAAAARRVVIVFDLCMPLASVVAASISGVDAYCFSPISTVVTLCFLWEQLGKPSAEAREKLNLPYVSNVLSEEFLNFYLRQVQLGDGVVSGYLLNTCQALEARFIHMLSQDAQWHSQNKTFAVGPLNMAVASRSPHHDHECLQWLDEQPPASVVYVSFGSTLELSDEQVAELAAGLEASGQRFVWVLKDADRADIYTSADADRAFSDQAQTPSDKLPPGFFERNEGVGKVLRSWAPQTEILAHPSTAAFMSHCGWNSCMESFSAGVPFLTWPMHSDQPMNALLATHVLGVGLPVCEWEMAEEVVPAAAISSAITKLMNGEEGREVRRKARELGTAVKRAVEEGGSSAEDMDAFVALITR